MTSRRLVVTRQELASVLGIALRTLDRLQSAEVVTPTAKPRRGLVSRYDLTVCVPAVIAHRSKPPTSPGALDPTQERAALLREQRRKLEREARVRAKELLEAQAVEDAWAELVDAQREAWLQLAADAVASGVVTVEQEQSLDDLARSRLTAFAARGDAR